ncbi:MAG: acyltransferase [Cellulomonadaceae bacterium]|nr:acyltransferase [Cellulomonadaceae bacterium]
MTALDTRTAVSVAGAGPAAASTGAVPTPAARATPTRFPLDSLRAIAAVSVVAFHAYQNNRVGAVWPWTGWAHSLAVSSDLAVDLFFAISGFLLWLPVTKALLAGRSQRSGGRLVMRRAIRLLPLYYVVLLVAWSLANPVLPGHWQDLLLHLTLTHVYSDQYIFWTVGPSWTLAVEFHAYVMVALMLPALTWLTPRLRSRGRRLAVAWGVPAVLVTIGVWRLSSAILGGTPETDWSVWFGPLAKAHLFGVGMALAVLVACGKSVPRWGRRAMVVVAVALVLLGTAFRMEVDPVTAEWTHILFAVVCALVLGAIVLNHGTQPRWLSWGPTVWIGTVSYSLYLVHELVMHLLRDQGLLPPAGSTGGVVVTAAATLAVSLVVARLSYTFVERPLVAMVDGVERSGELYASVGSEARVVDAPEVGTSLRQGVSSSGEAPPSRRGHGPV